MVLTQQSALTQKLWQNTNYLQLGGMIDGVYAVVTIFAQRFNICNSKFERIMAPIVPLVTRLATVTDGHMQGRNEGTGGHNSPSAESPWGRQITAGPPKSPKMSQVLSSMQYIFFPTTSASNMWAPNLLLAPSAI